MSNGAEKGAYKFYWLKVKYQEKQLFAHQDHNMSFLSDLIRTSELTKLSAPQFQNAEDVREI